MSAVTKVSLPHGRVIVTSVKDPASRVVLEKLNDNIEKLAKALSELTDAVNAL